MRQRIDRAVELRRKRDKVLRRLEGLAIAVRRAQALKVFYQHELERAVDGMRSDELKIYWELDKGNKTR